MHPSFLVAMIFRIPSILYSSQEVACYPYIYCNRLKVEQDAAGVRVALGRGRLITRVGHFLVTVIESFALVIFIKLKSNDGDMGSPGTF